MKRSLGTENSMIVIPFISIAIISSVIFILSNGYIKTKDEIPIAIMISLMFGAFAIWILVAFFKQLKFLFWQADFGEYSVTVKRPIGKDFEIEYSNLVDVGVIFILFSPKKKRENEPQYIYLSCKPVEEIYKTHINQLKMDEQTIVVNARKGDVEWFSETFESNLAEKLKASYESEYEKMMKISRKDKNE